MNKITNEEHKKRMVLRRTEYNLLQEDYISFKHNQGNKGRGV